MISKCDLIKLKHFCLAKGTIIQEKSQHTEWREITNSRIYKELKKTEHQGNPSKKWSGELNRVPKRRNTNG